MYRCRICNCLISEEDYGICDLCAEEEWEADCAGDFDNYLLDSYSVDGEE